MVNGSNNMDAYFGERLKVLVVSRSFYPENSPRSIRTTELVKEFARRGHDVTLLTLKDNAVHPQCEENLGIRIKDIGRLRFPAIGIKQTGSAQFFKRALRRLLLLLFEYPDIELMFKVAKALKNESGYDLLISVAVPYPVHWGVAKARRANHKIADIWIADCGDPYFGLENDSFKMPFYFSFVEKWFGRKADYITIPLEKARSAYFQEFHSKIRVIPQGLSFPYLISSQKEIVNEKITFAYFGNIQSYLHYAVPFLQKLNTFNQDFRFIIYTRDRDLFERVLTKETLSKCLIRDYVERDMLLEQLRGVDFLIHFPYQKDSQKSLKLIDYYFLDKPILSYTNDEQSNRNFAEFLNHNFEHRMISEDYTKYRIDNVCNQFIELAQGNAQFVMS